MHAIQAVFFGQKRNSVHLQQVYGVVETIVFVEIRAYGNKIYVQSVVGTDFYFVFTLMNEFVEAHHKRCIASAMFNDLFAVHADGCRLRRALKQNVSWLFKVALAEFYLFFVVCFSAIITL